MGGHLHFTDSSSEDTINKLSRLSSADDNDDDLLYENGTFVTCRNSSDSFYLCQVLQNVYTYTKSIRIRWCSVIGENGDDTNISIKTKFKLDYTDKLHRNTILMNVPDPIEHPDNTISLKKEHLVDTKRLLEKSIRGESISSDDMMDLSTEHQRPTKKLPASSFHIHFESSNESDTSAGSQSTISVFPKSNKRKKTVNQKKSRKQPAKRQRRTKASSEVSDKETKPVKPKKKRMNK